MNTHFELRFDGPIDDSAPTLRRIKGVFVADLDFPASDVQHFLANAPVTIKTAQSEEELKKSCQLLLKAGAKVLIVGPISSDLTSPDSKEETELPSIMLEFDSILSANPTEMVPTEPDEINSLDLSFDFSSDPDIAEVKGPEKVNSDNCPEPKPDLPEAMSFNLSLEEEKEDSCKAESGSGARTDSTEVSKDLKDQDLSLGLELEVSTPANSTLFGSAEDLSKDNIKEEIVSSLSTVSTVQEENPPAPLSEVKPGEPKTDPKPVFQAEEECEESPIEMTLEQLKELQRHPSKGKKLPLAPFLIVIGLGSMFLINQWFFTPAGQSNPFTEMIDSLPKLTEAPDSKEQAKRLAEQAAELAQSAWYSSEQNFPNRSVKATVWVEKSLPVHGSVEITTPEPPALSKEEIVSGVPIRPWLRRLELKDLAFKSENSAFVAAGPALAYISIGEQNIRLAGKATLKATLDDVKKVITLEAKASNKASASETISNSELAVLTFAVGEEGKNFSGNFEFSEKIELKR